MYVYLSGPMAGHPQSNYPLFFKVAETLRILYRMKVLSPAEIDLPEVRDAVMKDLPIDMTWGDFLARDVKLVADSPIDGMVLLPEWEFSRGAKLEAMVGLLREEPFHFLLWEQKGKDFGLRFVGRDSIKTRLMAFT